LEVLQLQILQILVIFCRFPIKLNTNPFLVNGSITTNSSAALIAETLQQIDRLGLELDNYCTELDIENNNEEKKYYDKQENIHTNKDKQKLPPPVPPKRTEVNLYI